MNIYCGNLSYDLSEEELREFFEGFGAVDSVKIITDKYSGRSKGFGFVIMPDERAANAAIGELDNTEIKGRNIKVNQSAERTDSTRRNFRKDNFRRDRRNDNYRSNY